MARKKETLTPRQRQSQQIMREKTAKKRRDALKRKMQFIGGAVMGVVVVGGGSLFWYSGALARSYAAISSHFFQATVQAGFAVNSLHVEGRNRTPMNEILQALSVKKGDPILELSLSEMRDKLKAIQSVADAAVERSLPGALYVRIIEREPAALWQSKGTISLVDDQGVVMQGIDVTPYQHLPLIVGEGAPAHVAELMEILKNAPEIAQQYASAIRVGDRRWNIRLKGNIELKLPEEDAANALLKLVSMNKEQQILERDITVIDMRIPDRVFIKLSPHHTAPSVVDAKET